MTQNSSQSGFTLVELAIVLMIIGLLIGGILKGQELINNARIVSVARQIKNIEAAYVTFQDSYGAKPGDIANATTRLPNCSSTTSCSNGDGNGQVGSTATWVWQGVSSGIATENVQFWKHLALANLIGGIASDASSTGFGISNPVTSLGPGLFFGHASTALNNNGNYGPSHYITMRRVVSGTWDCDNTFNCALMPGQAAKIDRKMDDGIAAEGDVLAVSSGYTAGCGTNSQGQNGSNGYAENKQELACDVFFKF